MYDPRTHRLDAQRARCGSKSPQKALPVDGVPWVRDADADCERGGSMRVVRLGGRGVHTQGSVPYARICVPCPLNVILTACEKDLGRVFRGRLRSRCRSSGVEFESLGRRRRASRERRPVRQLSNGWDNAAFPLFGRVTPSVKGRSAPHCEAWRKWSDTQCLSVSMVTFAGPILLEVQAERLCLSSLLESKPLAA